jgi:hypothetical protein
MVVECSQKTEFGLQVINGYEQHIAGRSILYRLFCCDNAAGRNQCNGQYTYAACD